MSGRGTPRAARIGLITTSFPRSEGDLAGCFVLEMARALASRGHRLEVIAPEPGDIPNWGQTEGARRRWAEEGIELFWAPYLRPRSLQRTFYGAGAPENLGRDPLAWPGLLSAPLALGWAAARRARSWDALISHWALPSGLIGAQLRRRRPELPHLAVAHSGELSLLAALPFRRALSERLFEGSSRVCFVSEAHRRRALSWLPERSRAAAERASFVSPMGVPEPRPLARERARRELGIAGDRPVLLTMGRLVPIKGLPIAIEAAAALPGALLLVAGEGPEEPALRALAASGAAEVRFLGLVEGERKRAALGAAEVFLLPSRPTSRGRTEGLPTALIEAMGSGLVPLASRTGGVPEWVEDGVEGRLLPPGDAAAFGGALRSLFVEPGGAEARARMAGAARARVEGLAWPRLIPRFEEALFGPALGLPPGLPVRQWRAS